MPSTVPAPPATVAGQTITADRLMNNPVLIFRLLRTLVQQRLIADQILTGRVDLTGSGSAVFEVSESIFSDAAAERVAALQEYPLTTDTPGAVATVASEKWALATEISDELVARNRIDLITRKLLKLANRIAFQFDALCLSAIGSAVTQTQGTAAAWSTAGADPFLDTLLSGAQVDNLNQGYVVDTIVARPIPWARLVAASKVLQQLPREGAGNPLMTGNLVNFAGLKIVKSTNLPAGVDVMVLDSTQLGSIAAEEIGGGYTGSADGAVQTKKIRLEENDGWRIQGRKVAVPLIQEPGAAIRVVGV